MVTCSHAADQPRPLVLGLQRQLENWIGDPPVRLLIVCPCEAAHRIPFKKLGSRPLRLAVSGAELDGPTARADGVWQAVALAARCASLQQVVVCGHWPCACARARPTRSATGLLAAVAQRNEQVRAAQQRVLRQLEWLARHPALHLPGRSIELAGIVYLSDSGQWLIPRAYAMRRPPSREISAR